MKLASCGNCSKENMRNCTTNCIVKTMESLEMFIVRLNTIDSCIGDYVPPAGKSSDDYVVSGIYIEDDVNKKSHSYGKFLSCYGTSILHIDMFDTYFGHNVCDIFNEYIDFKYVDDNGKISNYKKNIKHRLYNIQNCKELIVPVNVDDSIEYINDEGTKQYGYVSKVQYKLNKETSKIEGSIVINNSVQYRKDGSRCKGKSTVLRFEDFCKKWWVRGLKTGCKCCDDRLVSMSINGLIKPIEICNDAESVIIDNQFIYLYTKIGYNIIGRYTEGKYRINKGIKIEGDCLNAMYDNLDYLSNMQRLICVYGFNAVNTVTI